MAIAVTTVTISRVTSTTSMKALRISQMMRRRIGRAALSIF
jgi:hypothetical protein